MSLRELSGETIHEKADSIIWLRQHGRPQQPNGHLLHTRVDTLSTSGQIIMQLVTYCKLTRDLQLRLSPTAVYIIYSSYSSLEARACPPSLSPGCCVPVESLVPPPPSAGPQQRGGSGQTLPLVSRTVFPCHCQDHLHKAQEEIEHMHFVVIILGKGIAMESQCY